MITQIQFRHRGKNVHSLLIFNFGAVKDVIMVVPHTDVDLYNLSYEEKETGILFQQTAEGVWVCNSASINEYPETFSHLKTALLQHFSAERFDFRLRGIA